MRTSKIKLLLIAPALLLLVTCKKEFDTPPVQNAAASDKINIANIKAKFKPNINYKFKADSSLYCIVTADEVSGNLYKDIYVKDLTGALHIKMINSGGFFIGDSLRINIKGAVLNEYSNLIQLDSVDSDKSIVKLAAGYNPNPEIMSIGQIIANTAETNSVQSRLVQINNVEFVSADQGKELADAAGKVSLNRIIKSCDNKTLTIRTSGYANFAASPCPNGNGSIIGIVGQFGSTMQLILRNYNEINMNGQLCSSGNTTTPGTYLLKNFDDNSITSGGWTEQKVNGTIGWSTATFSGKTLAKISNFANSTNTPCENWLISPAMNLSNATNPMLTFENAYKFTGAPLECYVSTNYTGGAPSSATWVKLNFTLSSGNFVFVSSGSIPLLAYKSASTRIAFKYTGSASDGSTWEIDDVLVKDN